MEVAAIKNRGERKSRKWFLVAPKFYQHVEEVLMEIRGKSPPMMEHKLEQRQAPAKVDPQVQEVGENFESMYLQNMIEQLRKSNETIQGEDGGILPKSNAERIYQGLLDAEYARIMSSGGGVGIAEMIVKSLQENKGLGHENK